MFCGRHIQPDPQFLESVAATFTVPDVAAYLPVASLPEGRSRDLILKSKPAESPLLKIAGLFRFLRLAPRNASKQTKDLPKPFSKVHRGSEMRTPQFRYSTGKCPFKASSFRSGSWDAQVQELLREIEPTTKSRELVHRVERIFEHAINKIVPGAKVVGYASANPLAMKAFGIVTPEVDMVVIVPTAELQRVKRIHDMNPLKMSLRLCTNALVLDCGFKFRRSAFKAAEPKVVLNATPSLALAEESFGINLYVNASRPSWSMALFEECAWLEPRARDLILLVRRWARDRGILHGHQSGKLSPYVWMLLAIYFLQVGKRDEGPLLPAMTTIDGALSKHKRIVPQLGDAAKSVASLFKEFFDFYSTEFHWSREIVSISKGVRGHARARGSHLLVLDPFETDAGPIECLTSVELLRLREELTRAQTLCSSLGDDTLTELLLPWTPPTAKPSTDAEHEGAETVMQAKCQSRLHEESKVTKRLRTRDNGFRLKRLCMMIFIWFAFAACMLLDFPSESSMEGHGKPTAQPVQSCQ